MKQSPFMSYDPISGNAIKFGRTELVGKLEEVLSKRMQSGGYEPELLGPSITKQFEPLLIPGKFHTGAVKTLLEIGQDGSEALIDLVLKERSAPGTFGNVAVRTVFGASENMPLRALSYILPSLHLVESLRKSGRFQKLPQIQYLFMGSTGSTINGLDSARVQQQTSLFIQIARNFITRYYPDIQDLAVFGLDSNFMGNDYVQSSLSVLLRKLDTVLTASGDDDSLIDSSKHNARVYAALHPLVHDAPLPVNAFTVVESSKALITNPTVVINIGAQSEKPFYRIRALVRGKCGLLETSSIQLFSGHRVPPYFLLTNDGDHTEDLSLESVLDDGSKLSPALFVRDGRNNLVALDLLLLKEEMGFDMHDFLKGCGNRVQ
jgi:hypothetical protein